MGTKMHSGPLCATKDVKQELVNHINDCRNQNMAVTRNAIMRKLVALMPDVVGGIKEDDPACMEKFQCRFKSWYQRFRQRNKFSIQRKTNVAQNNPTRWEGPTRATILKVRGALTGIAKKRHGQERWGGHIYCDPADG